MRAVVIAKALGKGCKLWAINRPMRASTYVAAVFHIYILRKLLVNLVNLVK